MKLNTKLRPLVVATAVAVSAMAAPSASYAEISASATISSMYLWRGQDISNGRPALSGDLTYKHSSGLYAFGWASSEGPGNKHEVDFGVGYAGKIKDFGYDVGYYKFWYPETTTTFADAGAEYWLGLSFKDFSYKGLFDAKGAKTYSYHTLGYSYGKFAGTLGISLDDAANSDYKHFDLTYSATDRLSFTVSKKFSVGSALGYDTSPLFVISYSLPIDVK